MNLVLLLWVSHSLCLLKKVKSGHAGMTCSGEGKALAGGSRAPQPQRRVTLTLATAPQPEPLRDPVHILTLFLSGPPHGQLKFQMLQ